MSRLQALLAKIDGKDATDATPYLISNARENVRHYISGEYGIRWNLASVASVTSVTSLSPLASSDCPDDYALAEREAIQAESSFGEPESDDVPGFDDVVPVTMAQRRAINARLYGWVYPKISTEQEQQSCRR